jgi:hypothetical protein
MAELEELDGCELDFSESLTVEDDVEALLVPAGEEEDEEESEGDAAGPAMGDRGIAKRLRKAGLKVREVDGWKTRGRDFAGAAAAFNPKGSVNHHTGTPESVPGNAPTLGVLIKGRSDLNGPLANVYQTRNDTILVIAAGTTNHAGLPDGGEIRGMHGNSQAYGLEIEHAGSSPLPDKRLRIAARVHAALLLGRDLPARQVVQHREWAPSRKFDLASNFGTLTSKETNAQACNKFRAMVDEELRKLKK